MKYLILILFLTFGLQNDTVKVDTAVHQQIKEDINHINCDLDSIIAILKNDTIRNKKQ